MIILPTVGAELETAAYQAFQCQSRSQTLDRHSRTHKGRSENHRAPLQSLGVIVVYYASHAKGLQAWYDMYIKVIINQISSISKS